MEKVIEIENLTKSYGKFKAIDDLSIYVEKGKIFGLLGPNGSGKSTTINCILSGVLQLNNINFFETLDIALFFCQFFCIFYSYFLVLCDIIVSGGVSYG